MILSLVTPGPNSAEILPLDMTMMRWATDEALADLGGRVDDGEAALRALGEQPEHLGLGADVDAARGLVEEDDRGVGRQHLADDDLLLVAAGERADHRAAAGGLDGDVPDRAVDQLLLALARGEEAAGEGADRGEREVLADGHRLHQAVALAVLGDEDEAGGDALGDREAGDVAAVQQDAAAGGLQAAGDGLHHLGAAGAHQPVDADDLAGPHVEREAVDDGIGAVGGGDA